MSIYHELTVTFLSSVSPDPVAHTHGLLVDQVDGKLTQNSKYMFVQS